jgi:hypothetical protein
LLENAMGQPAINGGIPEIQPHQHLICPLGGRFIAWIEGRKPLTVRGPPSIRPPMAAGAIPPPHFQENKFENISASIMAFRRTLAPGSRSDTVEGF